MHNFCAGPAVIPKTVLKQAQTALVNFNHTGLSILSISHRDNRFFEIYEQIKAKLIALLGVPESFEVLIIPGGATQVFSMLPINLGVKEKKALYLKSGQWSLKAVVEAEKFIDVKQVDAESYFKGGYIDASGYDYVHYTDNETIDGKAFQSEIHSNKPVCCDMSSSFLSKHIDFNKVDLVYAGAQKNIGPSGACIVVGRKELFTNEILTASLMHFKTFADSQSLYNTPATFTWYVIHLVLDWVIEQGGIEKMQQLSIERSKMLYDYIDDSCFYVNNVDHAFRSRMNVIFQIPSRVPVELFLSEAARHHMYGLKGHKRIGGLRASLYNALEVDSVKALIKFMKTFEDQYAK